MDAHTPQLQPALTITGKPDWHNTLLLVALLMEQFASGPLIWNG